MHNPRIQHLVAVLILAELLAQPCYAQTKDSPNSSSESNTASLQEPSFQDQYGSTW